VDQSVRLTFRRRVLKPGCEAADLDLPDDDTDAYRDRADTDVSTPATPSGWGAWEDGEAGEVLGVGVMKMVVMVISWSIRMLTQR
jgi:hypothetical protein